MITGRRSAFEARCRQRGKTLSDVRACIVHEDSETVTVDETHPDYPRGPSPIEMVANFATAAAKHLAAGAPMASEETIRRRFEICQGCEHFDGRVCGKCGCPVVREKKYISKLSWADQSCPAGKWDAEKPIDPP